MSRWCCAKKIFTNFLCIELVLIVMMTTLPPGKIQIKETSPRKTVTKRTVCRPQESGNVIKVLLNEVESFLTKRKKKFGDGFTIYHNQSEGLVEVETGFIVDEHPKKDPSEEIELSGLPGGRAAFAVLSGTQKGLSKVHKNLLQWVALEGVPVSFPLTEFYRGKDFERPGEVEIMCWVEAP